MMMMMMIYTLFCKSPRRKHEIIIFSLAHTLQPFVHTLCEGLCLRVNEGR